MPNNAYICSMEERLERIESGINELLEYKRKIETPEYKSNRWFTELLINILADLIVRTLSKEQQEELFNSIKRNNGK